MRHKEKDNSVSLYIFRILENTTNFFKMLKESEVEMPTFYKRGHSFCI
ncbi:hypothetical protein HMPREF9075_02324 [Capnocytophaga sp. oral taxon 332 str. F0381]|nr:hypothetical protein HMPREF9075_02324 [Capnocytophaga sp. oral taxon 332 str. F0381]